MASIQATRLKKGMLIKVDQDLFRVLELQHVTPGNLRGFVRVKFRNIRNGTLSDQKLRSEDMLERAVLDDVPHVRTLTTIIGSERDSTEAGERGEHTAKLRIGLVGGDTSDSGTDESSLDPERAELDALAAVRNIVDTIPDLTVHVSRPVLFSFKTPVEVEVRGYDLDELAAATTIVADRLRQVEGLRADRERHPQRDGGQQSGGWSHCGFPWLWRHFLGSCRPLSGH